jgi:uncharacterized BrkB/YihY/UPF0761 family membrane protein
VLLFWLFLSAFAVLLGAELNAELELQTRQDTIVGPPEPMGRGAPMWLTMWPSHRTIRRDPAAAPHRRVSSGPPTGVA